MARVTRPPKNPLCGDMHSHEHLLIIIMVIIMFQGARVDIGT